MQEETTTPSNVHRFIGTFVFSLACFALGGDHGALAMLTLPTTILTVLLAAIIFTSAIYRMNLVTISAACFFLLLSNSGVSNVGFAPSADISLALAVTLAMMPWFTNQLEA